MAIKSKAKKFNDSNIPYTLDGIVIITTENDRKQLYTLKPNQPDYEASKKSK